MANIADRRHESSAYISIEGILIGAAIKPIHSDSEHSVDIEEGWMEVGRRGERKGRVVPRAQNTRRHAALCRAAAVICREALKMCGKCAARLAAMP